MFDSFMRKWKPGSVLAIDTETTGLSHVKDAIFGVSVATRADVLVSDYEDVREHDKKRMIECLNSLMAEARLIVNHNLKFDALMLMAYGVSVPLNKCVCSMVRASLIDEHLDRYSLDALSKMYLGDEKVDSLYIDLAREFGGEAVRKVQILNLHRADKNLVGPYARKDAELAYRLWEWQEKEIHTQELHQIDELERDAFGALTRMEKNGVRIDTDEAERAVTKVDAVVKEQEARLKSMIGDVNPNSPKQLTEYFAPVKEGKTWYIVRDGKRYDIGATKAGEPSWNAESMRGLPFEETRLIQSVKSNIKTRDTFLRGHVLGHAINGRVYPNINQTKGDDGGTGTGRLSYTEPALQQIPSRNEDTASIIRPVFLPEEGHFWVYGDLDQHEYRVFAHYANSPKLIKAYADDPDLDIHQFVAEIAGIPRNMKKEGGANAKQLNLSIVFCMSEGRVAQVLGLPFELGKTRGGHEILIAGPETLAILERYHARIPGVKDLQNKVKAKAKSRGYVSSLFGRRIRCPRGEGVYKSPGLLFQTTSGDLNKDNLVRIARVLRESKHGARLLLNIHDEYSMSVPEEDFHLIAKVQAEIQRRPELRVPIRIDFNKPASNWWLATQKEKQ